MKTKCILTILTVVCLGVPLQAVPETVTIEAPDLDQWLYPPLSGVQAGSYEHAGLFNKQGEVDREDRSGQMLVAYDLSSSITPGLGAENYYVTAVRLTVQQVNEGAVVLDNTYDSYRTYLLDPNDPNYLPDADAGRSIELYGAGLAEGWIGFDFDGSNPDGTGYSESTMPGGFFNGPRQVFAAGFDPNGVLIDVSNNVKDQFETAPWAVADSGDLAPGDPVGLDDLLTFEVNVNDPAIQAYLQEALNVGQLGLVVSSLHTAPDSFTRIYTKENLVGGMPARLEISYVANPATVAIEAPDLDQWLYPPLSGVQAGSYEHAGLFNKQGEVDREDRSGQMLVAYDLSSSIMPGLGAENYYVTAVRLTVQQVNEGAVVLDNTYDSYRAYLLDPNDPNYLPDADAGRSIELYGAGLAEGWIGFDFDGSNPDGTGYSESTMPGGFFNGPRQVFAASFDPNGALIDVSNNVKEQFETAPWAVADSGDLAPGDPVGLDDLLTFEVNVNDPAIQTYLQEALNAGQLGLVVSSLHTAPDSFTRIYTKENLVGGMPARLEIDYATDGGDLEQ